MTEDDDLVKRLRDRAKNERLIQSNNETVAAALMGQRLLFDQGHRSRSNTYAVGLYLEHEKCARQDAELAADWDEAADRIEALEAKLEKLVIIAEAVLEEWDRGDEAAFREAIEELRADVAEAKGANP